MKGAERHHPPFIVSLRLPQRGHHIGDPAHPPEPIDPCCLPALGEFTGWTPRGVHRESSTRLRFDCPKTLTCARLPWPTEDSPSGLWRSPGTRDGLIALAGSNPASSALSPGCDQA